MSGLDLFILRRTAALKQHSSFIHHQLSNPVAGLSDSYVPCCTCPHQRSRKLENTRTICFETGTFGPWRANGDNELRLSCRNSPHPFDTSLDAMLLNRICECP